MNYIFCIISKLFGNTMNSQTMLVLPVEVIEVIAGCDWRAWIGLNATCKGLLQELNETRFKARFIRMRIDCASHWYYIYYDWILPCGYLYKRLQIESEAWDGCNITYFSKGRKYKYVEWLNSESRTYMYTNVVNYYDHDGNRSTYLV